MSDMKEIIICGSVTGAWRCVIPTNVMGGTVVVTQGEPVRA